MTIGEKRVRSRPSGRKMEETPRATSGRPALKQAVASRRRIVFVLGMHRSGTSMVTRVFNLAGATLPRNIMPAGLGNPLGHWEPAQAAALNDEILSSVGLVWHSLANLPTGWFETEEATAFAERAAALLVEELPKGMLAVFKDPRICRLAPLWIRAAEMAGWEASAVIMLRNPVEIAASLRVRNAFQPAVSQMLTLKHMLEAERYSRNLPRSIVTYDHFLSDWRGALDHISKDLDLRWPRLSFKTMVEIDDFVSDSQRHHRTLTQKAEAGSSAAWGGIVFQLLAEVCDNKALDTAALDQISDRLNSADTMFGPLLAIAEIATETANKQAAERAEELAQLSVQLDGQIQNIAQQQLRTVALQTEVDHFVIRLAATEAERDAARQEATALGGRVAETEAALADAHRKVDAAVVNLAAVEVERDAAHRETVEIGARLAATEAERDAVRQEATALGGRVAETEAALADAHREVAKMEEQIRALSQMVGERDATLQAQNDKLESLFNQNAAQKEILSEHLTRFAQFDKALVEMSTQIAQIESEKSGLVQRIDRLCQSLADSERERESISARAQALVEERDVLAGRVADLESHRKQNNIGIENMRAEVANLKAKKSEIEARIAQHIKYERYDIVHAIEAIQADIKARDRQIANLVVHGLTHGINVRPEGFDEEFYLKHNRDVLGAIQSGALTDAFQHWVLWGVWEDRIVHFRMVQKHTELVPISRTVG